MSDGIPARRDGGVTMADDDVQTADQAMLDQEWAEATDWFGDCPIEATLQLQSILVMDDSVEALHMLKEDGCDAVARLANLALRQVTLYWQARQAAKE